MKEILTESELCERVKEWIDDGSYAMAADGCDVLLEADFERLKGGPRYPVFVIDIDEGLIARETSYSDFETRQKAK